MSKPKVPDLPPGWNKKIADLKPSDHGDGRLSIQGYETEWAREYERRLLRPWARFPRDGEVFECIDEFEVDFLTHWSAPFTGGGQGRLPKGTRIRVQVHHAEPVGVGADILDAPELEKILVPAEDRESPKYNGFSLSISTETLNKQFRLVGG